jgi:adenylosuccinate synthase
MNKIGPELTKPLPHLADTTGDFGALVDQRRHDVACHAEFLGCRLSRDDYPRPAISTSARHLVRLRQTIARVLLEGTPNVIECPSWAFPHVTSRDATVQAAWPTPCVAATRARVMVCRTYPIGVADPAIDCPTSGPVAIPISYEQLSARCNIHGEKLTDIEKTTTTVKPRPEIDWTRLRRSTLLNGSTDISLTFADYISVRNRKGDAPIYRGIERVSGVGVTLISTHCGWRDVIDGRSR